MPKLYFVVANFGSLGTAVAERDPAKDMDWESTVRDLSRGEWQDPRQIIEVDLAAGTSRDVTEKALLAAALVGAGVPHAVCA